ncbi:hypothetical protein F383_04803 [Gossypium arboreum]|uniref:Uncharacterized protein n=1 Tax=Gossypium arboreum TaxID=29729 RepID=A0A0B0MJG9_GOSAR|nr:hypothetical protein F383_04803 [Gossypium arboreum]
MKGLIIIPNKLHTINLQITRRHHAACMAATGEHMFNI